MAQLAWIQGFLLMILQLTVTADERSVLTRAGDKVTLSCSTVIKGQQKCDGTTWNFSGSGNRAAVELVNLGQIDQKDNTKADRLKLENCSLVIKKVREEDVGRYDCQQWKRGDDKTPSHQSAVALSVLHMTKQKKNQRVTLNCSVVTSDPCKYKVKWVYQDVDNSQTPAETGCSATSPLLPESKLPQCKVTQSSTNEEFTFSFQSSENSGGKVKSTKTPGNKKSTTTRPKPDNVPPTYQGHQTTTRITTSGKEASTNKGHSTTTGKATTAQSTNSSMNGKKDSFSAAPIIAVAVVSVIILIVAMVIIIWRAKGKKPQADENAVDLENYVSYATISHGNNTNRKTLAGGDHDAVTYSTVKACSSSAAASDDPNSFYSVITSIPN
ncbi:uncharacterized protein V3H82_027561 [Fundulus diaphanus]